MIYDLGGMKNSPDSFRESFELPPGFGVRWLAGNGADTAFELRDSGGRKSGVCPHPSPTAVQDAAASGADSPNANTIVNRKSQIINSVDGSVMRLIPAGEFIMGSTPEQIEAARLMVADLNLDMIREVRNVWQFYRDRRPETYQEMTGLHP